MTRVKACKYEQYSIFDIMEYLQERGFNLEFVKSRSEKICDKIQIVGTDVYIDVTWREKKYGVIFGGIRFEDYPRSSNFEKSRKIYETLKRNFGRKKDEQWDMHDISKIKDWDKIEKWLKQKKKF